MPRMARVVAVGYPHHITQRGNYGQDIFIDDSDRKQYLTWIDSYSDKYGLSLLVDCLMLNHVHFIGIPIKEDSMAKTFNAAHMRYAQYLNDKIETRGHLWQGRFYSCVLDEQHFILAARYIERNPVRANLVAKPWEWKWSSASVHVGTNEPHRIKLKDFLGLIDMPPDAWKSFIDIPENARDIESIRKFTLNGRPLGGEQFIESLENRFRKRLHALPRGRPLVGNR